MYDPYLKKTTMKLDLFWFSCCILSSFELIPITIPIYVTQVLHDFFSLYLIFIIELRQEAKKYP